MMKILNITLSLLIFFVPFRALAQISIIPANLDNRGFYLEIPAGETRESTLLVTNLSKTPASVQMYAVDTNQTEEGAFSFTTTKYEQKSIGLWAKTPENKIELAPRETKSIDFSLSIPKHAPPGAYLGGLAIEELSTEENSQITINSRVISKIIVQVPGKIAHKHNFSNFREDSGTFILELKNEGTSLLTSTGQVKIEGWPQKYDQVLNYKELQTPQGQISAIKIDWPGRPWIGYYKASANLRVGQYDFLKRKSVNHETLNKSIDIIILPWELLATALVLLLSIFGTLLFLRLRIKKIKKNCVPYVVKEGENINQIASKHKIKWQILAKINKIEAPYKLETGQKIIVPKSTNEHI